MFGKPAVVSRHFFIDTLDFGKWLTLELRFLTVNLAHSVDKEKRMHPNYIEFTTRNIFKFIFQFMCKQDRHSTFLEFLISSFCFRTPMQSKYFWQAAPNIFLWYICKTSKSLKKNLLLAHTLCPTTNYKG